MSLRTSVSTCIAMSLGLALIGCGGSAAGAAAGPATVPQISVTLSPTQLSLQGGGTAQISATVANDKQSAGVSWALAAGAPGTLQAQDALHALYTAPASLSQPATAVLTAISVASPGKTASLTVNLTPAPISVSASASPANLGLNQTSTLTASLTGSGNGVSWTLTSGPGTLTTIDSLHASYTSPGSASQIENVQVTATSKDDGSKTAQVALTVNPNVAVSVSANATALGALQGTLLTATSLNDGGKGVSWSLASGSTGTVTPIDATHAAYTAPETISAATTATVVATSLADNTKSASQAITLNPLAAGALPPWQNLVQFQNGLAYEGTNPPPYASLETAAGSKIFQSGLLIFHDTTYGTELWRLNSDPTSETANDGPLNRQPWDANGSHFQVWSNRSVPETNGQLVWVYSANAATASLVWPVDPSRSPDYLQQLLHVGVADSNLYIPWDPTKPGILYSASWGDTDNADPNLPNPGSAVYSIDMNNHVVSSQNIASTGFLATRVANLANPTLRKVIQSYPANDGLLLVRDVNPGPDANGNPLYIPDIYMVPTNPTDPKFGSVKYQYPINFGLSQFVPFGHTVSDEFHFHDIYFRRTADDGFIFNYGPLGSIGETVFFEAPVDGNPAGIQVVYSALGDPVGVPGGIPYYSHPAWNQDGSLVAYFGESSFLANDYGTHVRNHDAKTVVATMSGASDGHLGWDGFDPNFISFDGQIGPTMANGDIQRGLFSGTPNGNGSSHVLVGYEPFNPNTSPSQVEGPDQSPDATKTLFTIPEHFVTSPVTASYRRTYIAVDHRPFPPSLTATTSGSGVTLTWAPYLTHREIAGYHVYRSPQGAKGFQEISTSLVNGTTFTDTSAAAGQIFDYAVTAQENSGLESNELSNIEEVTIGGGVTQLPSASVTGWDTTAPAPPTNFTATLDPATKAFYTLAWTPSTSSDTRYYKVYYGDGSTPQAKQDYLIATPPAGVNTWIVWLFDPNVPPVFGLSAVDRQDNESPMACLQTANPTTPCQ